MVESQRWRLARFATSEQRAEFIEHVTAIRLENVEIDTLDDGQRVRFRAPARFEIGLASMIAAHGGKVLPSADYCTSVVTTF